MFNTCIDAKLAERQNISWPESLRLLWFLVGVCYFLLFLCDGHFFSKKVVNVFQKSIKISWYAIIVDVIDFFQLVNVTDIEQQFSCMPLWDA